jgi:hypothetical protein
MEVIAENHLTIFYPLAYFRVTVLNMTFCENFDGTKYQDMSFHWIPFKQIVNPEFFNSFISGFNMQLICYMADRIVHSIINTSEDINKLHFSPKIALINCDGREHWSLLTESIFMGQYMGGMGDSISELWANYNAFDFMLPS